jgi:uncharacterized protein YqgV (UPF0045/DUF77 family)
MNYQPNPGPTVVRGKEAERLLEALRTGQAITNPASEATTAHIVAEWRRKNKQPKSDE